MYFNNKYLLRNFAYFCAVASLFCWVVIHNHDATMFFGIASVVGFVAYGRVDHIEYAASAHREMENSTRNMDTMRDQIGRDIETIREQIGREIESIARDIDSCRSSFDRSLESNRNDMHRELDGICDKMNDYRNFDNYTCDNSDKCTYTSTKKNK